MSTQSGDRSVVLGRLATICGSFPEAVEVGEGSVGDPVYKVGGKIFAMLVGERLVLKLPAERCAELVAAGSEPFESGGRPMREWVSVGSGAAGDWPELAEEALAFARR